MLSKWTTGSNPASRTFPPSSSNILPLVPEPEPLARDLGQQPISQILGELGLKSHDLVAASPEQITHKMVARACKGRRLTRNVQAKIVRALNGASGRVYSPAELFNY